MHNITKHFFEPMFTKIRFFFFFRITPKYTNININFKMKITKRLRTTWKRKKKESIYYYVFLELNFNTKRGKKVWKVRLFGLYEKYGYNLQRHIVICWSTRRRFTTKHSLDTVAFQLKVYRTHISNTAPFY